MAYTFSDFKKALRAKFGYGQTNVSTDGGGNVRDHTARVFQRTFRAAEYPSTATLSAPLVDHMVKVLFVAEEECNVISLRVSAGGSLTISNTDHVLLTVIKRKATSFSLTESVATAEIGRSAGGSITWVNKAGFTGAATIATTNSVIDMDPGDSLVGTLSKPGAAVALQNPVSVFITVEEK